MEPAGNLVSASATVHIVIIVPCTRSSVWGRSKCMDESSFGVHSVTDALYHFIWDRLQVNYREKRPFAVDILTQSGQVVCCCCGVTKKMWRHNVNKKVVPIVWEYLLRAVVSLGNLPVGTSDHLRVHFSRLSLSISLSRFNIGAIETNGLLKSA